MCLLSLVRKRTFCGKKHRHFVVQMTFLSPNQQCQSTEGKVEALEPLVSVAFMLQSPDAIVSCVMWVCLVQILLHPLCLHKAGICFWMWLSVLTIQKVVVLFQTLPAQVAHVVVTGSSVSSGTAMDSSKSVIDLTDDDDTSAAAATKPPAHVPQIYVIATQQHPAAGLPPPLTLPSTAIVKPTMRPVPPPLHIAPIQQARLQVLTCHKAVIFVYVHIHFHCHYSGEPWSASCLFYFFFHLSWKRIFGDNWSRPIKACLKCPSVCM